MIEEELLTKAGMIGGIGTSIFSLLALKRHHHRSAIAPRKREGKVREHPSFDYGGTKRIAQGTAMFGAAAAGLAIATRKVSPPFAAALGIGGALALGVGASIAKRNDSAVSVVGAAMAGAVATAAGVFVHKNYAVGVKALKDFSIKQGPKGAVTGAINAIRDAKKHFPGLNSLLNAEGLGVIGALVTLPIAHALFVKHLAKEERKNTHHGDSAMLPSLQNHLAGSYGNRQSNMPLFANTNANEATVNFSGQVSSHYDTSRIYEGL